jgi:UDP-glucose 4-epimerase
LRDYVPVWDLARAHVAALQHFDQIVDSDVPCRAINLGTGTGVTVRELISTFEEVHGAPVPVHEAPRRPGDSAGACADASLAKELLGWTCEMSTADAIGNALAWDARRRSVLGYR